MIRFRAMSTDVAVTTTAGDEAAIAGRVAAVFADAERRFSRFRPDSELARLNRTSDAVEVSPELFAALARAHAYMELTGGLFDPGVGATLAALGYDRTFAPGALDRGAPGRPPPPATFRDVVLDRERRTVRRPEHVHIDLGGMIKGRTVDVAAPLLGGDGAIDAGGDGFARGEWRIEVEDPVDCEGTIAVLAVRDAAVATSAPNRRSWRVGAARAHHLIDPRTQAPARTDLLQATVVAPRAELADVLAKTAFLLGSDGARRFLERLPGVGGVLARRDAPPLYVGEVQLG
jgi:FAD:protein FMN transferase